MDIINYAKEIFEIEIEELEKVKIKINENIVKAVDVIMNSKGKVVITGVGKSGLIGKKIAATLASTGTLAVFMNSAEGVHGDLGMIDKEDVVIAISNSGNSDEVISIIPSVKKIGSKIIAMTGNINSKLGRQADIILNIGVEKEACPMNLAPTSSTTATLVMGDALAAILIKKKRFKPENFALYHPGGSLGRRLLLKVKDVMQPIENLALAEETEEIDSIIVKMTNKNLGAVCIMKENKMTGIITEGDIRRALKEKEKFFNFTAKDIMTIDFTSIEGEKMAIDAMEIMENRDSKISVLPVFEDENLKGLVRVHDLLTVVK